MNWIGTSLHAARTLLVMLLTLGFAHVAAASPGATRLAILYEGQNQEVQAIVDLVEGRSSRLEQTVVLDRTTLNRILAEQEISLRGLAERDHIIRAGSILGADLLVLITEHDKYVYGRILDLSTAALLGYLALDLASMEIERDAGRLMQAIEAGVSHWHAEGVEPLLISVSPFINRDVTREHDHLQVYLPELVRLHLSAAPSVRVLERKDLAKIEEERAWEGKDLQGYPAGALRVEGDLTMVREAGAVDAEVRVMAKDLSGAIWADFRVRGSPQDPSALAEEIAARILVLAAGKKPLQDQAVPRAEALDFLVKSRFFQVHGDFMAAADKAEIAHFLEPDNPVYEQEAFKTRWEVIRRLINWRADPREVEQRLYYWRRVLDDIERMLGDEMQHPEEWRAPDILRRVILWNRTDYRSPLSDQIHAGRASYLNALDVIAQRLQAEFMEATNDPCYDHILSSAESIVIDLSLRGAVLDDADEIRARADAVLARIVEVETHLALQCRPDSFDLVRRALPLFFDHLRESYDKNDPRYPYRSIVEAMSGPYLEELAQDDRPLIRDYATLAWASYLLRESKDYKKAGELSEQFLRGAAERSIFIDEWFFPIFREVFSLGRNHIACTLPEMIRRVLAADPDRYTPWLSTFAFSAFIRKVGLQAGSSYYEDWTDLVLLYLSHALEAEGPSRLDGALRRLTDRKRMPASESDEFAHFLAALHQWAELNEVAMPLEPEQPVVPARWRLLLPRRLQRPLVDQPSSVDVLAMTVQDGRRCVAILSESSGMIRMVNIDLRTGHVSVGRSVQGPGRGDRSELHAVENGWVFLVAGRGLYEVGRDERMQMVDTGGLFPVASVNTIAVLGKAWYLGMRGGIARWDREAGTLEILAADRLGEEGGPLGGATPAEVRLLLADTAGERLLALVSRRKGYALWSYLPDDGMWDRLMSFPERSLPYAEATGEILYLSSSVSWGYHLAYRLDQPEESMAFVSDRTAWGTEEWPGRMRRERDLYPVKRFWAVSDNLYVAGAGEWPFIPLVVRAFEWDAPKRVALPDPELGRIGRINGIQASENGFVISSTFGIWHVELDVDGGE